ncbi:MAG: 23S rRNA (cytidine(2498)-2'-O)-methyltransferase RlmM [Gammaproteobacteria bacterium]|nr:23S rRNA (cytidine(2498)-2'-O)-methyltransferase RlmM [Gammaproteobacteria bacterium]
MLPVTKFLLYCRSGFEGECAAEIQVQAATRDVAGYCQAKTDSGYVLFSPYDAAQAQLLFEKLDVRKMIFARQCLGVVGQLEGLPVTDRVTPVVQSVAGIHFSDVWLETADTNEAKELGTFCRKFAVPLRQALTKMGILISDLRVPRLHLFFLDSSRVFLCVCLPEGSSPWLMGIPRLKFPHAAPSRSTLKLEEALLYFLSEKEREKYLQPGMRAVDLGAAPGGWTYQLVRRHIHVTAIDNGPMAPELLDSGLVEHLRVDAFRYRPAKAVDWLVCDVVEQPIRIARLVAEWVAGGYCRHAIFNLKLPMKKRFQEVKRCDDEMSEILAAKGVDYELRFKQLYHDREEVTGYLRKL